MLDVAYQDDLCLKAIEDLDLGDIVVVRFGLVRPTDVSDVSKHKLRSDDRLNGGQWNTMGSDDMGAVCSGWAVHR